jgi:hypothetical protein
LDPDKIIRFYYFEVPNKSIATNKRHPTFAVETLFQSPVLEESLSSLQKRHQSLTDFIQQHEQETEHHHLPIP